ncbi:MAG: hypothetical protein AABY14_04470 [Nanoarchaeota archaeon]
MIGIVYEVNFLKIIEEKVGLKQKTLSTKEEFEAVYYDEKTKELIPK